MLPRHTDQLNQVLERTALTGVATVPIWQLKLWYEYSNFQPGAVARDLRDQMNDLVKGWEWGPGVLHIWQTADAFVLLYEHPYVTMHSIP